MNIDSIKNGIVIDHITAGKGMELYALLNLDSLSCPIVIAKIACFFLFVSSKLMLIFP